MFPTQIHEAFQNQVPLPLLNDTVRMLFRLYRRAYDEYTQFPPEVIRDGLPHHRRSYIEAQWPGVARRHQGVTSAYRQNARRSSSYAVVTCGQFVLTQSAVNGPDEIVRLADFRRTLARSSQMSLIEEENLLRPTGDAVYGILIHAAAPGLHEPSFADVVFPDPDCTGYLARIRLSTTCFAVWDSLGDQGAPVEEIEDTLVPVLRPNQNQQS